MSTVEQQVKAIVAEQLGVKDEQVTNAASFVDDLGADSLDTVELVMALEEEFEIEIPDEDAEKITTVQQAVDYISEGATRPEPPAAYAALRSQSFVSKRRVVITGLGLVVPSAAMWPTAWAAILRGESGIGPITRFDVSSFPTRIGGAVRDFDSTQYMSREGSATMDEFMHYGIAAGVQALDDAGMRSARQVDRDRCGVVDRRRHRRIVDHREDARRRYVTPAATRARSRRSSCPRPSST